MQGYFGSQIARAEANFLGLPIGRSLPPARVCRTSPGICTAGVYTQWTKFAEKRRKHRLENRSRSFPTGLSPRKDKCRTRRKGIGLSFERLEERELLSLAPFADIPPALPVAWQPGNPWTNSLFGSFAEFSAPSATLDSSQANLGPKGVDILRDFGHEGNPHRARLDFRFEGSPSFALTPKGAYLSLQDESLWLQPGEPIVPVRTSTLLLPAGTDTLQISLAYPKQPRPLELTHTAFVTPTAVVITDQLSTTDPWDTVASSNLPGLAPVRYQLHTFRGFTFATIQVFPIHWDANAGQLVYHEAITLEVTAISSTLDGDASAGLQSPQAFFREHSPRWQTLRLLPEDVRLLTSFIDNPSTLATYTAVTVSAEPSRLPYAGVFNYVVITSQQLQPVFERLVAHKKSRGLSATIVTTEYIASRYSGTESGDLADRIRQFITEAYRYWGSSWILLGGDAEIIPTRGVYARVGSIVDTSLATDLYYACLDGPWDGNRNGVWGEPTDGWGGRDIDLVPEVFVGRAPVSSREEATFFVDKVIRYESSLHPQRTTALWIGEQLDSRTDARFSGDIIRRHALPADWTVLERYDSHTVWTSQELTNLLNQSPHLVHHLGHASASWNARLSVPQVQSLTNPAPYIFYSQGCYSGAFDLYDIAIGEAHVVAPAAASAAVMNTRYGWYVPGPVPGGNHFYALEFFDALFNEGLYHIGLAHHDSKMDNLFRVQETGVYRWIHFGTVLLGDPEMPLQIGRPAPDTHRQFVVGRVLADLNGNGSVDESDTGLAGLRVFVDANDNRIFDQGHVVERWSGRPAPIPDLGILRTALEVNAPGYITQIIVTLSLEHQYLHDLEVSVISPSGTRARLLSRPPVGSATLHNLIFRDDAANSITFGEGQLTGTVRPVDLLRAFEGEPAQGLWTLEIVDLAPQDAGTLRSWSVEISFAEPNALTGQDGSFALPYTNSQAYHIRLEAPTGWQVVAPLGEIFHVTPPNESANRVYEFLLTPITLPTAAENLGTLSSYEATRTASTGTGAWFRFRAGLSGIFSAETLSLGPATSGVQLDLYDNTGRRLASAYSPTGTSRLDAAVTAGREYYLRLAGHGQPVLLRGLNLVSFADGKIKVVGGPGNDLFRLEVGDNLRLSVNGMEYVLPTELVSAIEVLGQSGKDQLVWSSSTGSTTFRFRAGESVFTYGRLQLVAKNLSEITVSAGGTNDTARIYGSTGLQRFVFAGGSAEFTGQHVRLNLSRFERIEVWAGPGNNAVAQLGDTAGNDRLFLRPGEATLYGHGVVVLARGFSQIVASAGAGGTDTVYFHDSVGDDLFTITPRYSLMTGPGYSNRAEGFRWIVGRSSRGNDLARIYDSPGSDAAMVSSQYVSLTTGNVYARAENFPRVVITATAGSNDVIRFFDSPGDDLYRLGGDFVEFVNSRSTVLAKSFDTVRIYGQRGGFDRAVVYNPETAQRVKLSPGWVHILGSSIDWQLTGISDVKIRMGRDSAAAAVVYDSSPHDVLLARGASLSISNGRWTSSIEGMARILAAGRFGARLQLSEAPVDYALELTGSWTFALD